MEEIGLSGSFETSVITVVLRVFDRQHMRWYKFKIDQVSWACICVLLACGRRHGHVRARLWDPRDASMRASARLAEDVVFAVIERHAKPQIAMDNCAQGGVRSTLSAVFPHCTLDPNLALREAAIRYCRQLSRRWGDAVPDSVPEVRNGLAMCPTHHRAFDQDFFTIAEQYKVRIARERLMYAQSPATARMMLDFHERTILLPKDPKKWPAQEFLRRRVGIGA